MERLIYYWIENSPERSQRSRLFTLLERWVGFRDGFKDGFMNVANVKFPIM